MSVAGSSSITLIGAPSSIGIKPYEDGQPRWLDRAPGVLRSLDLAARLRAVDSGDVAPPPYRDFERSPGKVRNEAEVAAYSRALATRVAETRGRGRFPLVLGGDCSVLLGCCLALRTAGAGSIGLVYADGHADFAMPTESRTGSAASMCLGLAVGRGETPLSRLGGTEPLLRGEDVALVGRRDFHEPWYGQSALAPAGVLDIPGAALRERGPDGVAAAVLERVGRADLAGFWIHVDADVLDAAIMPAVDSPTPDGPGINELAAFLRPLARHPRALGMELTIYDPRLDPDLACARRLVDLLEKVLT
jgi:arginase